MLGSRPGYHRPVSCAARYGRGATGLPLGNQREMRRLPFRWMLQQSGGGAGAWGKGGHNGALNFAARACLHKGIGVQFRSQCTRPSCEKWPHDWNPTAPPPPAGRGRGIAAARGVVVGAQVAAAVLAHAALLLLVALRQPCGVQPGAKLQGQGADGTTLVVRGAKNALACLHARLCLLPPAQHMQGPRQGGLSARTQPRGVSRCCLSCTASSRASPPCR